MQSLPEPPPAHVRAYLALLTASARLGNAVDADLRKRVGLTHTQFEVLARLGERDQGLRMAELAERLVSSPSGLSYQVQQLEKRGLLTRRRDAADERGIIAELTDAGRAVVVDATPGHVELVQYRAFGALEDDELVRLATALEAVSEALEG